MGKLFDVDIIPSNNFDKQQDYIELMKNYFNDAYSGKPKPKAYVKTFGCQQNVSDSEKIKGILNLAGYDVSDILEDCDLILYNTCAVRENAEDKVFGNIGYLKHIKDGNPNLIIALCGCMMEQDHVVEKVKNSYPYVDLVFGTNSIHLIPQFLYKIINDRKRVFEKSNIDNLLPEGIPSKREDNSKAWVPIMYGCDNFCTYCVVPYVRGRERSRNSKNIINEVTNLVSQGCEEITLLGQNVNSYGKGLEERINFPELLRMINNIPGEFKIKFMTSHPKDCSKELIDTIAECSKISHNLHLPVQSGSNRILNLMNRKYTVQEYMDLIDYAKSKIKDLILSTDIIVGFPGETYEDFLETLELLRYIKFNFLFNFIYSKRSGTVAAQMPDPISESEKHKWFNELLDVQNQISKERK